MLQRFFALSDVGTRNLRSSITLGVIINLFLMVACRIFDPLTTVFLLIKFRYAQDDDRR